MLVDRVGVLGDLYALADVAYVGGGFHAAGLHSVIEPAAFGAPVLFGPRHAASRDAALLLACRGGFSVSSADEIAMRTLALFSEPAARDAAGARARDLVDRRVGRRREIGGPRGAAPQPLAAAASGSAFRLVRRPPSIAF